MQNDVKQSKLKKLIKGAGLISGSAFAGMFGLNLPQLLDEMAAEKKAKEEENNNSDTTSDDSSSNIDKPTLSALSGSLTNLTAQFKRIDAYSKNIDTIYDHNISSKETVRKENAIEGNLGPAVARSGGDSGGYLASRLPEITEQIDELTASINANGIGTGTGTGQQQNAGGGVIETAAKVAAVGALVVGGSMMFGGQAQAAPAPVVETAAAKEQQQATSRQADAVREKTDAEEKRRQDIAEGRLPSGGIGSRLGSWLGKTFSGISQFIGGAFGAIRDGVGNYIFGVEPEGAGSTQNAETALNYFMSQGWTRGQAAGIVGNLQAESGANLNPSSIRHNDAGPGLHSYGIAQWNRNRWEGLRQLAVSKRTSWNDFHTQLEWVQHELTVGGERAQGEQLRRTQDAAQAAVVMTRYERFQGYQQGEGSPETRKRMANARRLYYSPLESRAGDEGEGSSPTEAELIAQKIPPGASTLDILSRYNVASAGQSAITGLHGPFADQMANFLYAGEQEGKTIRLTSGYRSIEHQRRLYVRSRGDGTVAPPGGSRHNYGLAVDLVYGTNMNSRGQGSPSAQDAMRWAHANAGRFGLTYRLLSGHPYEPWHLEPLNAPQLVGQMRRRELPTPSPASSRGAAGAFPSPVASLGAPARQPVSYFGTQQPPPTSVNPFVIISDAYASTLNSPAR